MLTPYGFEVIASNAKSSAGATTAESPESSNGKNINFAFLKGYDRFGVGASSNNDDTFYDYNVKQAFQDTSYQNNYNGFIADKTINPTFNLGSAVSVLKEGSLLSPNVGLNLAYNRKSKTTDFGYGLALNSRYLTLGASYMPTRADPSSGAPETNTTTLTAGTRISVLSAEYSLLYFKAKDPVVRNLPIFYEPTRFITLTLNLDPAQVTMAKRQTINVLGGTSTLTMLTARVKVSKNFALALLKNHIPGSTSLSAQVVF